MSTEPTKTDPIPPTVAPDDDGDGDRRLIRLTVSVDALDGIDRDTELWFEQKPTPEELAEAIVTAAGALAHLCGPDYAFALQHRLLAGGGR